MRLRSSATAAAFAALDPAERPDRVPTARSGAARVDEEARAYSLACNPGRRRTPLALSLAAGAVALSCWMGWESRAGSDTIVVAALGLAGLLASFLAMIVVGRPPNA